MVREIMERERMLALTGTAAAVDAGSVASGRDGVQSSGMWAARRVGHGTN